MLPLACYGERFFCLDGAIGNEEKAPNTGRLDEWVKDTQIGYVLEV